MKQLEKRPSASDKLNQQYLSFESLIESLSKKEIPTQITAFINNETESLGSFTGAEQDLIKKIKTSKKKILKLVEKELQLVPKNHYRNLWMALGISAFGLPLGIVFGLTLDNMAFLGIGLPFGIALGIALGTAMDNKALANNKQLDVEIK